MKNTKEVQSILAAIYCINYTRLPRDEDIHRIINYAFYRLFGSNTNLITLYCIGRNKEQMMPEVMQILESDTQYKKYLEENHK